MNEENISITPEELLNNSNDEGLIPVNSGSILVSDITSRFSSAVWFENIQSKTILIAGIGGIGSYVVFLLSRLNPHRLTIYDDDNVEEANMSGQLYGVQDIGKSKVKAISEIVRNFSNYYDVTALKLRFTRSAGPSDIMICGFDNMEARKVFFVKWLDRVKSKSEEDRNKCLYIDGRLNAEEFQILCIKGDDIYNIERYKKEFLFDDSDADENICSYKQTSFCASMIATYMVNLFVNFCAIEVGAFRELPFYTRYSAETMYLKIED